MTAQPRLETERLSLRAWTSADVDAFHRIWGDAEVIWWGPAKDRAASEERLRVAIDDAREWPGLGWWAVIERTSGEIVGNVGLQHPKHTRAEVELAYHFRRDVWGRGYATEASRALLDYALGELKLPRIITVIVPENVRSQHVARRLGFQKIGTMMHANLLHDLLEVRARPPS